MHAGKRGEILGLKAKVCLSVRELEWVGVCEGVCACERERKNESESVFQRDRRCGCER